MTPNNSAYILAIILGKAIEITETDDTSLAIGKAMGVANPSQRDHMLDFFSLVSEVKRSILKLKKSSKKRHAH
jgi:hypothetical protein